MNALENSNSGDLIARIVLAIRSRFSLVEDRADDQEIDHGLRAGAVMRGTNLWVLMFAIFIASIGLNVNSTAVIIGAMLISPLMGPIMAVGYGAGIHDFILIRNALKNLGIATLIALLTSTVYFMITPLTGAQSELLARTTPTIWDVLIALFGGLAGIIGVTRREKSNVIPGVAIATALMPPLCTAGYGLANGAWGYFLGAFYLFTINSVFIAASAAIVTRAFRLERKHYADARVESRVRLYMAIILVVTLLPSLYLAYQMVGHEIFRTRAMQFVQDRLEFERTHVSDIQVDAKTRRINVSLIGEPVSQSTLADITSRLPAAGLPEARMQVFQVGDQRVDVATLKSSLLGDLYKESQLQLAEKEKAVNELRAQLATVTSARDRLNDVPAELHALFPQVTRVLIFEAPDWESVTGMSTENTLAMNIRTSSQLTGTQREQIKAWLRARCKTERVHLVVENT